MGSTLILPFSAEETRMPRSPLLKKTNKQRNGESCVKVVGLIRTGNVNRKVTPNDALKRDEMSKIRNKSDLLKRINCLLFRDTSNHQPPKLLIKKLDPKVN